eukprot:NODE_16347_length_400_cov_86.909747_g16033_i0.p1 GENE.NODE_16347_length_400_cov_86.909747_g16033_i0~~NODE_16347_length_400_cov_86.909747_g16033_i0.p1  ORF type:complete len:101 (-),score=17.58 NODE_16347_length_400_cov_86.909747_g16033_i0:96-356(-)
MCNEVPMGVKCSAKAWQCRAIGSHMLAYRHTPCLLGFDVVGSHRAGVTIIGLLTPGKVAGLQPTTVPVRQHSVSLAREVALQGPQV